ncbi:MAG: hypothetical protein KatS3mg010_0797 [Acidimicrobiia bacterium]|nr:MAG: hypothetical protein KatS3mg010_0797 [Acidimicrobiia bacterium]
MKVTKSSDAPVLVATTAIVASRAAASSTCRRQVATPTTRPSSVVAIPATTLATAHPRVNPLRRRVGPRKAGAGPGARPDATPVPASGGASASRRTRS